MGGLIGGVRDDDWRLVDGGGWSVMVGDWLCVAGGGI